MFATTLVTTEVTGFVIVALFVALFVAFFVLPLIPEFGTFASQPSVVVGSHQLREDERRPRPAGTHPPASHRPTTVRVTPTELDAHLKAAEVATGQPLRSGGWDVLVPGYPCLVLLVVTPVGCQRVFLQSLRPIYAPLRAQ